MSQQPRFPSSPLAGSLGAQREPSDLLHQPLAPVGAQGPRRPKNRGLIIGASVLALVLLIAGAVLTVTYQLSAQRAEADRQAGLAREKAAVRTAAQTYFAALAQGDADKALRLAAAGPGGNNQLLSREVLLEANARAAITQVTVDQPQLAEATRGTWTEGTVAAHYLMGDQPTFVDLPVRKVGAEWKIGQVAAPVQLGLIGPERVVNGVKVAPGEYNLFPGSYSVTSANPLVGLGRSEFVLAAPGAAGADWSSEVMLSPEGTNQSMAASRRALDQCLQRSDLAPPECPFIEWAEGGLAIEKNTIRYTLKNDPWVNAQFAFDAGTLTATASVPVEHEIRAQATQNGTPGTLIPQTQRRTAHIMVKVQDGTPQVTFT